MAASFLTRLQLRINAAAKKPESSRKPSCRSEFAVYKHAWCHGDGKRTQLHDESHASLSRPRGSHSSTLNESNSKLNKNKLLCLWAQSLHSCVAPGTWTQGSSARPAFVTISPLSSHYRHIILLSQSSPITFHNPVSTPGLNMIAETAEQTTGTDCSDRGDRQSR